MVEKEVTLQNKSGLHARPASMIVSEASKYKSEVAILKDDKKYNGKSIMSILSMGAAKGDSLVIQADGVDKEDALEGLANLILNDIKD